MVKQLHMKDHRIWFINYLNENNSYGIVSARFNSNKSTIMELQRFGSYPVYTVFLIT